MSTWLPWPRRPRRLRRSTAEHPTALADRRLPDRAGQDVRRFQAHQVIFTPLPLRVGGETIPVPEPGPFQLVTDAAGVGERGLTPLQRQIVAKCRLRFVRQVVGRPV